MTYSQYLQQFVGAKGDMNGGPGIFRIGPSLGKNYEIISIHEDFVVISHLVKGAESIDSFPLSSFKIMQLKN